ncbi:hypothetical protein BGW39_007937 [Mortierella sp. 14UC]|nr:hypothetical protein BGW39_007937 [Mortierella sp. 14UC]
MKFHLLAALTATIVSALPKGNSTVATAVDLAKSGDCRPTTFTWSFDREIDFVHLFKFEVDYLNGQPNYVSHMRFNGGPNDKPRLLCHRSYVWCIKYSGWDMDEEVIVYYAHLKAQHVAPTRRIPNADPQERDTFEYDTCFPW